MPDVETLSAEERPGDPCTIVIFGSAGDLTKRKLLPALYNLSCYGLLPRNFALVGVARQEISGRWPKLPTTLLSFRPVEGARL